MRSRAIESYLPVTLPATILLGLLGVSIDMASLGEVTGEMLFRLSGTVGEADVVTVIQLVGSGH